MKPHLKLNELQLFDSHIKTCKHYFEYGSGGSTYYVYTNSSAKIHAVDGSVSWLESVDKNIRALDDGGADRVKYQYVNIGETGNWGFPRDQSEQSPHRDGWLEYSSAITQAEQLDTVMVDGRFRVACVFKVLRESLKRGQPCKIFIHDYDRAQYKIIDKHLPIIDFVSTLCLFETQRVSEDQIEQIISDYQYVVT